MELVDVRKRTKGEEKALAVLERVERDLSLEAGKLSQARADLQAAEAAAVAADAEYTTAVQRCFHGEISRDEEQKFQEARETAAGQVDRLRRLIPGLEQRLEAKREQAAEARRELCDEIRATSQAALDVVTEQVIDHYVSLTDLRAKVGSLMSLTLQACAKLGQANAELFYRLNERAKERGAELGREIILR